MLKKTFILIPEVKLESTPEYSFLDPKKNKIHRKQKNKATKCFLKII